MTMSHKKYYGYKPKHEYYSVVLHERKSKVGDLLNFVFEDGCCGMNHYYWGSEIDYEYNRHGEVEHNCIWDEANTKLLMLRTGTKNGKALVNAMYGRFHEYQGSADFHIRQWCEKKGIKCEFRAWF